MPCSLSSRSNTYLNYVGLVLLFSVVLSWSSFSILWCLQIIIVKNMYVIFIVSLAAFASLLSYNNRVSSCVRIRFVLLSTHYLP